MKKFFLSIVLFFVAAIFPTIISAQIMSKPSRTISVSGEAEIRVTPDEAVVLLGIETRNKDLNAARSENDKHVQDILRSIKSLGIEAKYIQTDYLDVNPTNEYEDDRGYSSSDRDKKKIIYYVMRKNISVTVKDLTKLEDVVTNALKLGANYIDNVQFRTTQLRKHKDDARVQAIRAAKEKATLLAKELGQSVGKPETINEQTEYYTPYGYNYRGRADYRSQNVIQNVGGSGGGGDVAETFSIGTVSVKASVSVVFHLD
jgi:uncharacterized protein